MILEDKKVRHTLENIVPQTSGQLNKLRFLVEDFVETRKLVPPLQEYEILSLSEQFVEQYSDYKLFKKLIAVIINNCAWKDVVASIPFERRLLLLPKCFSNSKTCKAKIDELGLLCEQCGGCVIADYIAKAEQLGYHVIVSEGTGTVAMLLGSGQIECVVGIACLESFERSFPLVLKQAIPSIAIPLYNSDCKDSKVCEEWVNEILVIRNKNTWNGNIDIETNREIVNSWISDNYFKKVLPAYDENISIANNWLLAGGKRWRPLIMLAIYKALNGNHVVKNDSIAKLAIAIESFHKASLAHDDIADNDPVRYDEATLHEKYNLPIALNIGDLLISYGYQMIAESGFEPGQIQKLLAVAAQGHRELCLGQGQEFLIQHSKSMLSVKQVIDIFTNKTAPAFEVAFKFGAIAANADKDLLTVLGHFSRALGIAYQIQDDLEDFNIMQATNDIDARRPSLILAFLNEKDQQKLDFIFNTHKSNGNTVAGAVYKYAKESGAIAEAQEMLLNYKFAALKTLEGLTDSSVKSLLYRLLNNIIR